jgi:hypothetical protein
MPIVIINDNISTDYHEIKYNLLDFTHFCSNIGNNYKKIKTDKVEPFLDNNRNLYDYAVVISAGHLFWQTEFIDKVINYMKENKIYRCGNDNLFFVDLKSNYENEIIIEIPKKFLKDIFFCHPKKNYEQIKIIMKEIKTDILCDDDLKKFKDELLSANSNLAKGFYVLNTELINSNKLSFDKTFDSFAGVCGGIKVPLILNSKNFSDDCKILMFDISEMAIKWQKKLINEWDGDIYKLEELTNDFKKQEPKARPINTATLENIEKFLKNNLIASTDIKEAWNKFKSKNIVFKKINLLDEQGQREIIQFLSAGKNNFYLWLSNSFFMEILIFSYGYENLKKIQNNVTQRFKNNISMDGIIEF